MGELIYAPLDPNAIPTLNGIMLLILSALLLVIALRAAKNGNASNFLISFIGISAIVLGANGFKIVTEVNAGLVVLDKPEGGNAPIFALEENDYTNTSGVPLKITSLDVSAISCSQYQGGSSPGECSSGKILSINESCNIDCSPPDAGVIQFASATYSVGEDSGNVNVEVIRFGGSVGAIEVSIVTLDGSAASPADYNGIAVPVTIAFPDGDSSPRTVSLPINTDILAEPSETFTVEMSATDPAILGSVASSEVTITDVPLSPSGVIRFASSTYTVAEDAGTVTFELNRIGGSFGAIEVSFVTADGTAVAPGDYSGIGTPLIVSWPDGNTNPRTITLPIVPDILTEPNETFTGQISATDPAWLGSVTSAEVTIENVPTGVVEFSSATYTVAEDAGTVTFELNRIGGSFGAIEVSFVTVDGTAVAPGDYSGIGTPLIVSWPDGNTNPRTITLPIVPDILTEPNETFTGQISATDPAWLGSVTSAEVTIENVPTGVVEFSSATYTVAEDAGTVTFELNRIGGSFGAIEVSFVTVDGTAVAPGDYSGIGAPLIVSWPDGNTNPRTITLPIVPDILTEPNETFTAQISATDPAWLGSVSSTEVTITDVAPP